MTTSTRQRIGIGDIFRVSLSGSIVKYFQFIAKDTTQLDSDVIKAFRDPYTVGGAVNIERIIQGDVDFYAHVFLKIGLKQSCWQKVGHSDDIGRVDIIFRNSNDYGNPRIRVSHDWHVWKIGEPFARIGKLTVKYQDAEIGVVVPPDSVLHRMRTGVYDFIYPNYQGGAE